MHLSTTATEIKQPIYSTKKFSNRWIIRLPWIILRPWGFLCVSDTGRTEVTKSLEIVTNFSKDVEVFLVAGIWNSRTTGFIMLTLIYVISTALLSAASQTFLLAKRPQWRGARRNGCFRRLQMDLTKNKDFIAAFKMFRRFWLATNTRFKYCS